MAEWTSHLKNLKRVKMKARGGDKLSMEKYMEFAASHKQTDLKVEFLNQIISMHGFKKVKLHKSSLMDAVNTIDLMNPSRSTLKKNIFSAVSITLNDVMEDLNDLGWQECCVISIQVLNSPQGRGKENENRKNFAEVSTATASASTPSYGRVEIGGKAKRWTTKTKRNTRGRANSSLSSAFN